MKIPDWIESALVTDCKTIEEFAHKYYKPDRFTGRGVDYVDCCLKSHRKSIEELGYTCLSHHDKVTGRFIAFAPKESE